MSQIIQNEAGEDVEVFTADELQTQKQAALEDYMKNNPDKTEELTKLQQAIEAKDKELKGLKDKDFNFANLRKDKDDLEKKLNDAIGGIDTKIEAAKKEVLEGVLKDHKDDLLKKLAGDDAELLKKIELKYSKDLGSVVAATKDEITQKINSAYLLATGKSSDDIGAGAFSSGGVGRVKVKQDESKLSADEKKLAIELANQGGMKLTDKDLEGK